MGYWVNCLSNQVSDGPSFIPIDWKKNSGLLALKTLYFHFCKVMKK